MKPLRARLQEARKRLGLPWEVLERDYLLSWILAGIGQVDSLPEACSAAAKLLDEHSPVEIHCERYTEKHPHPGGQEAFTVHARFPWQRQPQTRVMIETAVDEKILKSAQRRKLIHEYGEPLEAEVRIYSLEEIVAEKLRAILQHVEKLEQRGWSRSRARDYYDLWRVLRAYREQMDLSDFPTFLRAKCAVRNVTFAGPEDFFQDWNQWLGPLVPMLAAFDTVIGELRPQIASFIPAVPRRH